jgi:hypothetical protein
MRKWLVQGVALLLVVAVVLGGVAGLGRLASQHLRQQQQYTLSFADISCAPPPGLSRTDFLDEVQYFSGLPDQLVLLEPDLAERLAAGFGKHPWVAKVERVEVVPPDQVRVRPAYRRGVLAVPSGGRTRVVDAHGVLLPRTASVEGLPIYTGHALPPAGPAGARWGDPAVEAAAGAASRH